MAADSRKQSCYFARETLDEIRAEAERLDRSFSWVVAAAWKRSREDIRRLPSQRVPE